jgi:predicted pyridoxine 5'-phosphate oxidase superfamily flavin-nucleotide-binding protein
MKTLTDEILQFFQKQNFIVISTIDGKGMPHNSCKGIVEINKKGRVYVLDLYKAGTYKNLKRNPHIAVTAVDEHKFKGFCLKGKAEILPLNRLNAHIIKA